MSVVGPEGFEAAGVACGIKGIGALDLALVATTDRAPAAAAATFTRNRVLAAPIQVSKAHVRNGAAAAVVLNAGNANAATGSSGRSDARRMCELVGEQLGCATEDVLVCSTGLIGVPMPMGAVSSGIPKVARALAGTVEAGQHAADAIRTTDTVRKESRTTFDALGGSITVGGMAKGAAMLAPSMATMLAVLTTDAAVSDQALRAALDVAVDRSFNALLVDGSMSTNDTVVLLASGRSEARPVVAGTPEFRAFVDAVQQVCSDLAGQMAHDAEGATKCVRLTIRGSRTPVEARRAARAVASSQLVQCSLNGEDPYWGRILSELGASGVFLDMEQVDIAYGGITVCERGVAADHDAGALALVMAGRDIEIACDLHQGPGRATMLFTDLSHAYVEENRGTS